MRYITMIRQDLYENKNGTVSIEYSIYNDSVYEIKTKSQLTKTEKKWIKNNGLTQIFHF